MASAVAAVSSVVPLSALTSQTSGIAAQNAGVRTAVPLRSASIKRSSFAGRSLASNSRSSLSSRSRKAFQKVRAAVEPEVETEDPTEQLNEQLQDQLKGVQEWWDKQDDKFAIIGLGVSGIVVLWASSGLLSSIEKLPVLPGFFEFVGILFTGWFVYRYLLFKPDREELVRLLDDTKKKITGEE